MEVREGGDRTSVWVSGRREEGEGQPRWKEQLGPTYRGSNARVASWEGARLWQEGTGLEWDQSRRGPERPARRGRDSGADLDSERSRSPGESLPWLRKVTLQCGPCWEGAGWRQGGC